MIPTEAANFAASVERSRAYDDAILALRDLGLRLVAEEFRVTPVSFELTQDEIVDLINSAIQDLRDKQRANVKPIF